MLFFSINAPWTKHSGRDKNGIDEVITVKNAEDDSL